MEHEEEVVVLWRSVGGHRARKVLIYIRAPGEVSPDQIKKRAWRA